MEEFGAPIKSVVKRNLMSLRLGGGFLVRVNPVNHYKQSERIIVELNNGPDWLRKLCAE